MGSTVNFESEFLAFLPKWCVSIVGDDALSKLTGGIGTEVEPAGIIWAKIEGVQTGLRRDKEATEALGKNIFFSKLWYGEIRIPKQSFLDAV